MSQTVDLGCKLITLCKGTHLLEDYDEHDVEDVRRTTRAYESMKPF